MSAAERRFTVAAGFLPLLLGWICLGCKSTSDPSRGFRVLEAVVVEREYEPPGSGSADFRGSGNWYLVFEAREGEAMARYRFQVTQQQYIRFPEGARVQITLAGNDLRDVRRLP